MVLGDDDDDDAMHSLVPGCGGVVRCMRVDDMFHDMFVC
jgi:hypothetical protein